MTAGLVLGLALAQSPGQGLDDPSGEWCDPTTSSPPIGDRAGHEEADHEEEPESRLVEALPKEPLEIHAWAEAGYMLPVHSPMHRGAYLSMARLQGRLSEEDFDAFIQVGADQGDLKLLDARITWRPNDRVVVRAGHFKTPMSAEYLIPANHLIFIHRSLHMDLVSKRAMGGEGELHLGPEGFDLGLQAGIYNPAGYAPVPGTGELLVGRLLLDTAPGLLFHASGGAWLHNDEALNILGEDAPAYDRHLVGGVLFEERGWTSVVEAAWAERADDGEMGLGGVASIAHRFPAGPDFDIEPAAAVEFLQRDDQLHDMSQIAVNFHKSDWNLVQTVEWEMDVGPDTIGHSFYVQIQAGL